MAYSDEVLADSPAFYLRLEESSGTTAADSSGNSRPGDYVNSPTLGTTGLVQSGTSLQAVTLDGSESEGAIDTWTWTQTVGPSVGALTNPNTAAPSFAAPAVVGGTALTFTLSTSAASVPSGGTDSVTVTVLAPTELMDDGAGTLVPVRVRMES